MRRWFAVFLTFASCIACGEGASRAERSTAVSPAASRATLRAPRLPELGVLARSGRPVEPVKIFQPLDGSEVSATELGSLAVGVRGPATATDSRTSLVLSLDGARPRPVVPGTLGIAELVEPGVALGPGTHDLVLVAVGPDGIALEPSAGGVASVRFYVGSRATAANAARLVCLAPFGTYYGSSPAIALDFVVVPAGSGRPAVEVALESSGGSRRARAVGSGPFALGEFESGDHRVTLSPVAGAPAALSGTCGFTLNRELERSAP